jgi:Flp pilus assembly protein TadG
MWKDVWKQEDGSVLSFTAFLIPVIIALGGLLIDFGMVSAEKSQLSNAVDSAAWAALDSYDRELWDQFGLALLTEPEATQLANQYLKANMPQAEIIKVVVNGSSVEVEGKSMTTVYFIKLFGIESVTIKASAKAKIG